VLADVERVCDEVAILDAGHLVTSGTLPALLERTGSRAVRIVATPGQHPALAALTDRIASEAWAASAAFDPATDAVTITPRDAADRSHDVLAAALEAGLTIESFERVHPSLEDAFLGLVGRPGPDELDGRGFRRPREVAP
jgi:ABC-2 type transport system ATP-binding protein